MLKGNMVTLLKFNILNPGTISNHKRSCSMKVKVQQKLPRFLPDYNEILYMHHLKFLKSVSLNNDFALKD